MKVRRIFHLSGSFLSIFLIMMICFITLDSLGQKFPNETKKERKKRHKQEQLQKYNEARNLLVDSGYVIPFERVLTRHGEMITGIRSELNYLFVYGDTAVLQFRSGHALWSGVNGLGGLTLKGLIVNKKIIEKENKHRIFITFTIEGNIRNRVSISLSGSNEASVDIDHPQYGRAESLRGTVEPIGRNSLFEGTVF